MTAFIFYTVNRRARRWAGTYNPEVEAENALVKESVQPIKSGARPAMLPTATLLTLRDARWYPLVYLLVSIMPLVNRVHNAVDPANPSYALYSLHAISAPLQGARSRGPMAGVLSFLLPLTTGVMAGLPGFFNTMVYAITGGFFASCTLQSCSRVRFWPPTRTTRCNHSAYPTDLVFFCRRRSIRAARGSAR